MGKADIVINLDMSDSIHRKHFQHQLRFVQELIGQFNIDTDKVRIGVMSFATYIQPNIYLNDYHSKSNLINAVGKMSYAGGRTNTDGAIKFTREVMFSDKHGSRTDVPHINIIVTDDSLMDWYNTALEASISRSLGIHVLVVGVGMDVEVSGLKYLVNREEQDKELLTVDYFSGLNSLRVPLVKAVCEGKTLELYLYMYG